MMIEDIFIYIVAGIIAVILILLIFKHPYLGIAFTVASMPVIVLFPSIPFVSSISLPLGFLTLAAYLFQSKGTQVKRNQRLEPVYLFGILFIFWIVISNPKAALLGENRIWALTFAQLWILMFLSGKLLVTPERQRTTMLIFALAAMISAIFAIAQGEIAETATTSARVSGLATNANQAARYFVIALVFFYYLRTKTKSSLQRFLYLLGILITFLGVFFTVSRSGMLLLFGALGLILIFQPRVKNKVRLIVLVILALLGLSLFSDSILQIIRDIFPAIQEGSDTVGLRYNLWRAGWKMWLDHPIIGVGIGQYGSMLWRYMIGLEGPTVHSAPPHNTYIQALSETGLIGFLLFMVMLIYAFRHLWPRSSNDNYENEQLRNTWFIILLLISVGGISIDDLANKILWMVLGVSVAFSKVNVVDVELADTEKVLPAKASTVRLRLRRWKKNTR